MTSMSGRSPMRGAAGSSSGNNATGQKIPKGYEAGSTNNFTPEMMDLFRQMFSHVDPESFTSKLASGDQAGFEEMERPALRQFNQLSGQNASRFSGMGMGARRGSGFQNFQNQAASDFAQDLASKRMGLQRQAIQDLSSMSNSLLGQRPQENFLVPKQKPWWQELLMGVGQTAVKSGVESMFKGQSGAPGAGG
jgi:hypothetical protein